MKRISLFVLIVVLLLSMTVYAENSTAGVQREEVIDIGYYDIWLYSDGVTWQKDIKPGSSVTHSPTITIPVDDTKNPTDFSVKFLADKEGKYEEKYFDNGVKSGSINSFKYLGNGKLEYSVNTLLVDNIGEQGFDITKEGLSELVTGKRFYIPVKVSWEYTPKEDDLALYQIASGYDTKIEEATVVLTSEVSGSDRADNVLIEITGGIEGTQRITVAPMETTVFKLQVPQTDVEQKITYTATLNNDKTFEEQDFSNNTVSGTITIPALTTVSKCSGNGTSDTATAVVGGNKVRRCSGTGENRRCHYVCTPSKTVEKDLKQSGSVSYSEIRVIGDWSLFKEPQQYAKKNGMPYATTENGSTIKADSALNFVGIDKLYRGLRSGSGIKLIGNITIQGSTMATSEGSAKGMAESFRNSVVESLEVEGIKVLNNHQSKVQGADKSGTGQESVNVSSVTIGKVTECGGSEKTIYTVSYKYTYPIIIDKPESKSYSTILTKGKTYTAYDVENAQNKWYTHINTMDGIYGLRFRSQPDFSRLKLPSTEGAYCESSSEQYSIFGTKFEEIGGIDSIDDSGSVLSNPDTDNEGWSYEP